MSHGGALQHSCSTCVAKWLIWFWLKAHERSAYAYWITICLRLVYAAVLRRAPLASRPELGEGGNLRPVVDLLVEQVRCRRAEENWVGLRVVVAT